MKGTKLLYEILREKQELIDYAKERIQLYEEHIKIIEEIIDEIKTSQNHSNTKEEKDGS